MRRLLPFALALPALAQAGVTGGVQLSQYAPHGYSTIGAHLILAPHPYNTLRLRAEFSLASQDFTDGHYSYSGASTQVYSADYVHYHHGWNQPGFLIGCGVSTTQASYDRTYPGGPAEHRSEAFHGGHFLIGGQFGPHVALEARLHVTAASDYPAPVASVALSVHF